MPNPKLTKLAVIAAATLGMCSGKNIFEIPTLAEDEQKELNKQLQEFQEQIEKKNKRH